VEQKAQVNQRPVDISPLANFSVVSAFVLGFVILLTLLALSSIDGLSRKINPQASTSPGSAIGSSLGGKIALVQDNIRLYVTWPSTDKEYLVVEVPPTKKLDPYTHELVENTRESIIKPMFSPDGKHLAYERTIMPYDGYVTERPGSLWVADGDGRNTKRIADDVVFSHWSDDGKWVYCYHIANESAADLPNARIWQRHEVESGKVEVLMDSSRELDDVWLSSAVSSKGKRLYVEQVMDAKFGCQVEGFKLVLSDSSGPVTIAEGGNILGDTQGRVKTMPPLWSPDGRYVATTIYSNIVDGWQEWKQWDKSVVYLYDTQLNKGRTVGSLGSFVCWTPDSKGLVVPNGKTCGVVDLNGNGFTSICPMAGAADWTLE
jgi:Tol biopolymer transport system component